MATELTRRLPSGKRPKPRKRAAPPKPKPRKAPAPKPPKKRKTPKHETPWQRRIRRGLERGLTRQQAAGKPRKGDLSATVLRATREELLDANDNPTPLLKAELQRITDATGREGILEARERLLDLLGPDATGSDFADLFSKAELRRRVGYNLFHATEDEVGWDY